MSITLVLAALSGLAMTSVAVPARAHQRIEFVLAEHLKWRLVPVFVRHYGASNSRSSGITHKGFSPRATR